MKFSFLLSSFLFLFVSTAYLQNNGDGITAYRASIHRPDKNDINFTILESIRDGKPSWVIQNADEKIELKNIHRDGDSLFAEFPVFESQLHVSVLQKDVYSGLWFKGSPSGYNTQPISIYRNAHSRFNAVAAPTHTISGRWAVTFIKPDQKTRPAIAEFKQDGKKLTGTFITPSGDYRYLDGVISGDSLELSTFDGSHAFYFRAFIENDGKIRAGIYCSGTGHTENWFAIKNDTATLPGDPERPALKNGMNRLNFSFPDLNGKMVSIHDERFKNKVVIIQLMGSWCSNCMDETAFVSDFYLKNKNRGVEMIALAYEYSTDPARSKKSLLKFQERFHIQYPILITGVTASDSLKTEKTLPQLQMIEGFPTTIFIDKSGVVRKIHKGFNGPATGEHYEEEKEFFGKMVDELLR